MVREYQVAGKSASRGVALVEEGGMSPERFVEELDVMVRDRLARLGEASAAGQPARPDAGGTTVADLLVLALKKELEASEEAALWMTRETDTDVKLALA